MAALSVSHCYSRISQNKNSPNIQQFRNQSNPRVVIHLSCQSKEPKDPSNPKERGKEEKQPKPSFLVGFEKLGKGLKEGLSPQKKGDWKDVTLMSLSFAVYVYISQQIVCAYFAWMSMPKAPW